MALKTHDVTKAPEERDFSDSLEDATREMLEALRLLNDPDAEEAVSMVINLIENPDVAIASVDKTVIKLEALAAKFGIHATYYKTIGRKGDSERHKKDMYYTLRELCHRLADSVKYVVRVYEVSR